MDGRGRRRGGWGDCGVVDVWLSTLMWGGVSELRAVVTAAGSKG